jgi:hypothetical protein
MKKFCGFFGIAFCLFLGIPQSKADICGSIAGNLVANCGFELGSFSGWSLKGNDVPGEEGNLYGVENGADPVDGISPNSGSNQAFFADLVANATTISQTLTTVAGGMYEVSFFLAQDTEPGLGGAPNSNELIASFGGTTLTSLTAIPVQGYTEYSFATTASSASSVLSFKIGNDLGESLLDDVSVVATPEPSAWILLVTAIAMAGLAMRRAKVS